MPDDTQGQVTVVEETTTDAMPASEKPAELTVEDALPEGASDRTREQFEKLKQHNQELAARLAQYEAQEPTKNSVLDELRPSPQQYSNLSQAQVDQIAQSYVDQDGYVDMARVEAALKQANDEASKAREEARLARERVEKFEETATVRKLHEEFPELDPYNTSAFDPKFYDLVKNELVGQMMRGQQDPIAAARKAQELYDPRAKKAAVKAVEETKQKETQTKRDQAATPVGSQKGLADPVEHDRLVEGTRNGDRDALYKRLQASGY